MAYLSACKIRLYTVVYSCVVSKVGTTWPMAMAMVLMMEMVLMPVLSSTSALEKVDEVEKVEEVDCADS